MNEIKYMPNSQADLEYEHTFTSSVLTTEYVEQINEEFGNQNIFQWSSFDLASHHILAEFSRIV